jgi:hypothetical protein
MSYRLATEYTNSRLELTKQEILRLCLLFQSNHIAVDYAEHDGGWCEIRMEKGNEILEFFCWKAIFG